MRPAISDALVQAIAVIFLVFILFEIGIHMHLETVRREAGASYQAAALSAAHADEHVRVNGVPYDVIDGTVYEGDQPVHDVRTRTTALQIAYVTALARRTPFFALSGTDLGAMHSALDRLERVRDAIADVHTDPRRARVVRESLYPLRFLRAIHASEEMRRTLLADPSPEHERAYRRALETVAHGYSTDLEAYTRALASTESTKSIVGSGGVVTKESMLRAATDARLALDGTRERMMRRDACARGMTWTCDTRALVLAAPQPGSTRLDASLPVHVENVIDILSAGNEYSYADDPVLMTKENACAERATLPHYFLVPDVSRSDPALPSPAKYVGDLLFTPVDPQTNSFYAYLSRAGLDYALYDETRYYICRDIRALVGHLLAIKDVALFLGIYEAGDGLALSEESVLEALNTFTVQALATHDKRDLDAAAEMALMVRDRSAGLDRLISNIARVDSMLTGMKVSGIAEGLDMEYLLLARSGFPPLFELQNRSVIGDARISVYESAYHDAERADPVVTYREISQTISPQRAAELLHLWNEVHAEFKDRGGAYPL